MENQIHTVGERVEKLCPTCNEQLGHFVKSVTKQGKISRVTCSVCGVSGTYKASAKLIDADSLSNAKNAAPYDRTRTYRTGQTMSHPNFGVGVVTSVFPANTIDVLFLDRVRRLIHARV